MVTAQENLMMSYRLAGYPRRAGCGLSWLKPSLSSMREMSLDGLDVE